MLALRSICWNFRGLIRGLLGLMVVVSISSANAESITLGAEDAWYPYSGIVKNEARGFTVDLVRAAYAAVGIQTSFVPLPYARCTNEVKRGHLLGCFNTARSAVVEPDFLWHRKPMFFATIKIYGRSPSKLTNATMGDLVGKRVAVTNGYEYGDAFDSSIEVVRDNSPNDISALRKLALGRVDYALVYSRVYSELLKVHRDEIGGKIVEVGELERLPLYISFSKTFPDSRRYVDLFERGYDAISKSGRLKELEKQWE